jgi:hypothetical protein
MRSANLPDNSRFRVEKARTHAMLTLANGETVPGCFFVAGASARSSGPERVLDVLNAEPGFFPFEVQEATEARTVIYNRSHVMLIALADDEARRVAGYDLAARRAVSLSLANGSRVEGYVRVYRPEGRDRLSDWARNADQFRYIETDEVTLIVNMAHVVEVHESA